MAAKIARIWQPPDAKAYDTYLASCAAADLMSEPSRALALAKAQTEYMATLRSIPKLNPICKSCKCVIPFGHKITHCRIGPAADPNTFGPYCAGCDAVHYRIVGAAGK